jgi:hypothetical protein
MAGPPGPTAAGGEVPPHRAGAGEDPVGSLLRDRRHHELQPVQPIGRSSSRRSAEANSRSVRAWPMPAGPDRPSRTVGGGVQPGQSLFAGAESVEDRPGKRRSTRRNSTPAKPRRRADRSADTRHGQKHARRVEVQPSFASPGSDAGRQQAGRHVHPLQAAAEHEHIMARVPADARFHVTGEGRRALPDVREERRRTEVSAAAPPGPGARYGWS